MNKFLSFLFIVYCISILFSCSKEYSQESDTTLDAQGSLWDSTDACLPETVHGTFYNGIIPGKDTAYVEVQVNVTQTGSYNITSDLQNGFQFLDSGFFSSTGINIIHLKPIGAPIIPVSTIFSINFDSSFCSFTVNVQDSTGTGLGGQDSTGNGDPDQQSGTWQFTEGIDFLGNFDSTVKDNSSGSSTIVYLRGVTSTGDTVMTINFVLPTPDIETGTYTTASNSLIFAVTNKVTSQVIYQAGPLVPGTDISLIISDYDVATQTITGSFSGPVLNALGSIVTINNGSFTAKFE